jgi:starch synthase
LISNRPIDKSSMRVSFITSELTPFSKTGGLADVSDALPIALAELGVDVSVFTPFYRSAAAALARLGLPLETMEGPSLWIGDGRHRADYRIATRGGCRLVFVAGDAFFDRPGLYAAPQGGDYPDNIARFAFLCRAALEFCLARGERPDIVHLNDWQTALVPVYLRTIYRHPTLSRTRSVFTIHNLAYQGRFPPSELYSTGLDWGVFHSGALEFYGMLNLLKGGLVFADALTTVSPSYAEETQRPEFGHGLDGVVRAQRHKLTGILNGVDAHTWNPATDPLLPAHFHRDELSGKAVCKRTLQERFGLPVRADAFLLGTISRFDVQKGIPLIGDAMRMLAPLPVQLAALGSGDPALERRMRALAAAYPQQVSVTVGFDEGLAHLIEAGADAFLMPSAYEPCGLNQMYSQRYGTAPIVHATGGLKDTVIDATPARLAAGTASGFSFDQFDAAHLAEAVLRAWRLHTDDPSAWRALQRTCMDIDHSWARSAQAYADLYRSVLRADAAT